MLPQLSDQLTTRFYQWEERGRGWHVFEFPVELEPGFHPFFGHFAPPVAVSHDDGKRHTILSGLASVFSRKKSFRGTGLRPGQIFRTYRHTRTSEILILQATRIVFPKDEQAAMSDMSRLLMMLSYTEHTVSFEIVATQASIGIQLTCNAFDEAHVCGQVKAYFPSAILTRHLPGLDIIADNIQTCVIDFGLKDEFMRPLALAGELKQDPYMGLFGALEQLSGEERGIVQILFKGTINPWSESIIRAVSDGEGGSFFADAPDMLKLAQQKVSAPLFAVCVRVAGQARSSERAISIATNIGETLVHATRTKGNALQILPQHDYPIEYLIDDVLLRQSHRLGMLLSVEELATLAHFPTDEVTSQKIERDSRKTKFAPVSTEGNKFVLGTNVHQGIEKLVSVPASLRLKHTHIIGATGTGKSTLLLSMIAQDMARGNGLAVLDPHGDLIETALAYVPENRINDVIIIDPADGEFPVAFNVLSAHSEVEKDILSSDLVAAFKRLSTSWGDQMNSVLANAILAFLESTDGGTLIDLRRFLLEKPFRDKHLKTVADPHVVYYWQHEYPLLKSSSIGSILTRLDTFLRPKLIRNMVIPKKGLDFEHILDSRKILFVKLSQGLIGAENSFLLGTFFVSKMYQAAMARQAKSKENRSDFFLYIDEFQNFITPSMSHILSGARKYHLGLILAHQDMQQLTKYDTELASSVAVNAGTRICFRLGDTDARRFAGGFSYFEQADLENLGTGEAIARIEQPSYDFSLSTIPLPEVSQEDKEARMQAVIAKSRELYGTPRAVIEESLTRHEPVVPSTPEPALQSTPQTQPVHPTSTAETAKPAEPFVPVEVPRKEKPKSVQKTETEHRYLQTLIKRMAESRGFKAAIEERTPDGNGRVDVSLERAGRKIAVEISVTTTEEWEAHNVEKCLAAGYDEVVVCSKEMKHLQRIRGQLEGKLDKEQLKKVSTFVPDDFISYLNAQVVQKTSTEKVIKGYRVKVEFDSSTSGEMNKKQGKVVKTIATAARSTR